MCNTVSKVENCGNKVIKLGSGTYGTVYLYNGGKYKTKIALKKMKIDDKYICDGYIRDVIILRSVSGKGWNNQKFYKYKSKKSQQSHPNIILFCFNIQFHNQWFFLYDNLIFSRNGL